MMSHPTLFIRWLGFWKIPMLFYARPRIMELTDLQCTVKIPLRRRTKNHLGSMYFAALMVGADLAGGLIALSQLQIQGKARRVSLIFKDVHGEFLKRAEADVVFQCSDGEMIQSMIDETLTTGERVSQPVFVIATTPAKTGSEPVARFQLTLSLKVRQEKG